jgi:hypothetical protein
MAAAVELADVLKCGVGVTGWSDGEIQRGGDGGHKTGKNVPLANRPRHNEGSAQCQCEAGSLGT